MATTTREVPWNSPLRDFEEDIPKLNNIFRNKTHMCQFASLLASESQEAKELGMKCPTRFKPKSLGIFKFHCD